MTATVGFLSVRRHPEYGYFGGYLITNQIARPLEFHCTMPVKPSRAQELLYGPTIDEFVCGEQIAKALTMKAKLKPEIVLSDIAAALALSHVSDMLIAKLDFDATDNSPNFALPVGSCGGTRSITVDRWQLSVAADSAISHDRLTQILSGVASNFDLTEPFQRISDALLEAHPIAKAA